MSTEYKRTLQRRDTAANWTANNPVLGDGEFGFEKDTKKFKIGDGSTDWNTLTYCLTKTIDASKTYDPGSIASGAQITTTVTTTGAAMGDFVQASFSLDLAGLTLTAYVSAADTVTVVLVNHTVGAVDLASGTLRVRVQKA